MIYYVDEVDTIGEDALRPLLQYLSAERRDQVQKYRFPSDRVQSALAFLLLRYALLCEYGITESPKILRTEYGKPYLAEHPKIHFNLSHCKLVVACGVADHEIGVDVQELVPFKQNVADYFMTPQEIVHAKQGSADEEFTRLWTLKESYGKYLGSGICYEMSKTPMVENQMQNGYLSYSRKLDNAYLSVTAQRELPMQQILFAQLCSNLREFAHGEG